MKAELDRLTFLAFLRGLDAHALDLTGLPAKRRRFQAAVGRRLTAQSLDRREPQRRHPTETALLERTCRSGPGG